MAVFLTISISTAAGGSPGAKSDNQKSKSPAKVIAGRQLFATACASCHGLDARGGERAPNILTRPEVERMSDADISRVIREGTRSQKMPAFGSSLDAAAIADVTRYLRSLLQNRAQSAHLPGDPAAGKTLFFGKAACADCHMINGAGGFLGADLSAYASSHSIDQIREAIINPNKTPDPREKTASVVTRGGERFTGIARNEDNFSLQLETPDGAFHLLMKSDLEHIEYPPESLMPADYGQRLDARELNDLISFLVHTAATSSNHAGQAEHPKRSDDDR